jgi:hypothetical protein
VIREVDMQKLAADVVVKEKVNGILMKIQQAYSQFGR